MVLACLVGTLCVLAGPATEARAASCTSTVLGPNNYGASFGQQATFDFCDGHIARVGVRVTPYSGYRGANIKNCVAHLELTDITLGPHTRSDRTVNCTANARRGGFFTVGPSQWSGQDKAHHAFRVRAFVNIETYADYYNTEAAASKIGAISCSNIWTRQDDQELRGGAVSGWFTTRPPVVGTRAIKFAPTSGYRYYRWNANCDPTGQKSHVAAGNWKVRECPRALACTEYPGPGASDWYSPGMVGCPPITSAVIDRFTYSGCDGYASIRRGWN